MRIPVAHQAVRKHVFFHTGRFAQALYHDLLADPDAEATGDDLVEHEKFHALQPAPRRLYPRGLFLFRTCAEILYVTHPLRQALGDRFLQGGDVRHRFREVAHYVVAGLEEPIRDPADLRGPLAQLGAGHRPLRTTPAQQRDHPQLVVILSLQEIPRQRIHLGVGAGGSVQFIEQLGFADHGSGASDAVGKGRPDGSTLLVLFGMSVRCSAPSSPANSVDSATAS